MKVIICDDEKAYVESIKQNVDVFFKERNVDAQYSEYTDCKSLITGGCEFYDIAFLDIEMGDIKGTDVAAKLKEVNPQIIVFIITSYDQYLDEAMDLNVFRYIKKPLDVKRLFSGLEKALQLLDQTVIEFYLKKEKTKQKVLSKDIIYVEIVGHSTKVVTTQGEYISDHNMRFWREKLVASFFFQAHNSFIINLKYITEYQRDIVKLNDKYDVPVSCRTQASFRKYFMKYNGER